MTWGEIFSSPSRWEARILYRKQAPKGKKRLFFASRLALKIIFTFEMKKSRAKQVNNKIEQNNLTIKVKKIKLQGFRSYSTDSSSNDTITKE